LSQQLEQKQTDFSEIRLDCKNDRLRTAIVFQSKPELTPYRLERGFWRKSQHKSPLGAMEDGKFYKHRMQNGLIAEEKVILRLTGCRDRTCHGPQRYR